MTRFVSGLFGLLAAAPWPSAALGAADCDASALKTAQPLLAEAEGTRIAFVPRPLPVPVGRHFAIDFVVCRDGAADGDAKVQVDADMPAHRHGMNYRTTVSRLESGVYRAQGLMFHMPGRWRVIFDLASEPRPLRLTRELEVQ